MSEKPLVVTPEMQELIDLAITVKCPDSGCRAEAGKECVHFGATSTRVLYALFKTREKAP